MALALGASDNRGGYWGQPSRSIMSDPYAEEERQIREEIDRLSRIVQLNTQRFVQKRGCIITV